MILVMFFLSSAWTESFETEAYFPPNDWMVINEDALDAIWFMDTTEGYTGVQSATCYDDTTYSGLPYANLDYLVTPRILPASGEDSLVRFWCRTVAVSGCSLEVLATSSVPPAHGSFASLASFQITDTLWTEQTVNLSTYIGTPVYVAFRVSALSFDNRVLLDDITLPAVTSQPHICNGRLRTKGPPSQKYLQVWGTHYEMGFAHGYLLGEEAMANMTRFAVGNSSYHYFTPFAYEYGVLPYFRSHFTVPQKYQDEVAGAYDGCVAKGVDLFHPELGRSVTQEDIVCLSALCDYSVFGCSSISGWGQSTGNDTVLQGGLVIARDLDYRSGLYTTLGNTGLIIACAPSAADEQDIVLLSMSGFVGCLSGVNSNGVGLFCDYGNYRDTTFIPPNSLVPFGMSCRHAVESVDPDTSGINDVYDIIHELHDSTSLTSWDIHLFSPYDNDHPLPAAVLEINNVGDSLRTVNDNYLPPAISSSWNLVVTNHDRVYHPPVYCVRYQLMADSLNNDYHLNVERAVNIEDLVAGWSYYAGTIQSMVIMPNKIVEEPDEPCVGISYAARNQGAHVQRKLYYTWEELFEGIPAVSEKASVGKKTHIPFATIITGPLVLPADEECKVFDITGREVKPHPLTPGIYFIEINSRITQKVIKIR